MGNLFANLMLLAWPLVCLVLFARLPVERALVWSLLGAYLLLPPLTEFDLPLVPDLDKYTIPNLTVAVILIFLFGRKLRLWPEARSAQVLVTSMILSAVFTVMTNADALIFEVLPGSEPIRYITNVVPGLSWRDLGSVIAGQVLALVPFLLARQFLATETGLREILVALTVAALVYSIPALIELRLSPVFNIWFYGFFQHDFGQMIRGGGFRPIVFLPHALWLATFFASALLACGALTRNAPLLDRWKVALLTGYLVVILFLCKSLAAFLYGMFLLPVVLFVPPRWQLRLALSFALVALVYPMLRNGHFIPLDWVLDMAGEISASRQQSLGYRFDNEEQLLARAAEKPLFGWGEWGRNLLRDPETGIMLTVPDGRWIITFGSFGWFGYLCEFGLLALPVVLMWVSLRRPEDVSPYIGPLCLILGATMLDMLLNDTLTPLTWLIAGAILGHAERRMPRRVHGLSADRSALRQTGRRRTVL
jgi:hypothetical protein